MAGVVVSDEDSSLKALLETASSLLATKSKQDMSRKHQPKITKVIKHKKKPIRAVSKKDKGSTQGMLVQIDQLHLEWTEDEDDEDTCHIEKIPAVKSRDSKRQALKSLHNVISFSSDSDSSPVKKHSFPQVFHQQRPQLTEERTMLKDCQAYPRSSRIDGVEVITDLQARSSINVANGNGAKVKSKRSEGKENRVSVTGNGAWRKEIDSKMKTDNTMKGAIDKLPLGRKTLGGSRRHNAKLHSVFGSSDSSSESEMASVSVLSTASGAMSDSDGEDFVELSHKLEQLLSISTSQRMQRKAKKPREDTMHTQGKTSPGADSGFPDQHDMSKGDSSEKCSSSVDTTNDEMLSPIETGDTGVDGVSVTSDTLPEMKEISLQVSMSSDARTSPETSIERSLLKKTMSTEDELIDKAAGSTRPTVVVFSEDAMKDASCLSVTDVEDSSCTDDVGESEDHEPSKRDLSLQVSLSSMEFSESESSGSDKSLPGSDQTDSSTHLPCLLVTDVKDRSYTGDIGEYEVHELSKRDLSLQGSLSSTKFSESESSGSDKSLPGNDHTDSSTHLPAGRDCSLQVSVTSSMSDGSQVSSESVGDERTVDNHGACLLSETSSSCDGNKTCDGDVKLKKKLFPRWTAGGLMRGQNELSSLMKDSGIGATGGTHTDRKLTANRSEGASYIDLCEDDADAQEPSLSHRDGSHMTTVGSTEVKEYEDLADDWLPDLDSSSEEDLEAFLDELKTPKVKKPGRDLPSMDEFIVDDSDVSSDDDGALYVTAIGSPPKYSSSTERRVVDSVFVTPSVPPIRRRAKTTVKRSVSSRHHDLDLGTNRTPLDQVEPVTRPHSTGHQRVSEDSFLRSLDQQMDNARRHPEAARYVKDFKKLREDLTTHLFRLYNRTVFAQKLPEDMSITWNKRLIKTAGFCAYSKRVATPGDRNVRIELSVKVCDTAERVRDTLIHELCHAAVWFLNGVNDGHGSLWKYWAHAACRAHPELPPIKRCHKYKITHKFTYKCTKCGYEIGRHSKSLDTKAKVCGYCRSPFVLVNKGTATPRTPNKFALFVKDNYGSVKQDNKAVTHQDVMRILSSDFARQNSISSSG